jgi:hypothetical protein
MGFARGYLRVLGAMSIVFGLIYLLVPEWMTDPTGFGPLPPNGKTDVRATYGGFQLGAGLFVLWAAAQPSLVRPALLLQVLTIGAIAVSRAIGFLIDGSPNTTLVFALASEIALTGIGLFALRLVGKPLAAGGQPARA